MGTLDILFEDEVIDAVRSAAADGITLATEGQATKRAIGQPITADNTLSLKDFSGITAYEPGELYLTAKAGTPLADVTAALAEHNQMLAFEPPFTNGTIGGLVMTGLAGPRRFKAGGVRDHILGMRAVSGRGELFRSGGTVVKNVTGYDLPKLITASWGTLAVLTEVTLKVLPAPRQTLTLKYAASDMAAGLGLLRKVWRSPYEPTGLVWRAGECLIRLEGMDASVMDRAQALQNEFGQATSVQEGAWSYTPSGDPYWRCTVQPDLAADFAATIGGDTSFDWAGGLVHVRGAFDQEAAIAWLTQQGGGLTIMAGADRPQVPLDAGSAFIHQRLKNQFDPEGILNPGRLLGVNQGVGA